MILRSDYVNEIKKFINVKLIKILTGVRRSGKSTIFNMIKNELVTNYHISKSHIISRKYSDMKYDYMDASNMYHDLINEIKDPNTYYLFLDELQEINSWEKVINDLFENYNVDIYVTGSNSRLMSSEIATYLSGRYVSIPIYTLSFKEYLTFKNKNDIKNMFDRYLQEGGFPLIGCNNFDTTTTYQIVNDIYNTIITNDISKRHKIRNNDLFNRVVKYVIENVGKTFSVLSIVKFLKNEKRNLSVETIYNYLKWLEDAFIIYPCNRYDIQGKAVLKTQEKYYLSDVTFKYSKFNFNYKMISSVLENIIFLELKRRKYDVFIGKFNDKEIDFVATNKDDKIYVQVCTELPTNSNHELECLKEINDSYRKYLVTNDPLFKGNDEGIEIIYIADFLLKEKY